MLLPVPDVRIGNAASADAIVFLNVEQLIIALHLRKAAKQYRVHHRVDSGIQRQRDRKHRDGSRGVRPVTAQTATCERDFEDDRIAQRANAAHSTADDNSGIVTECDRRDVSQRDGGGRAHRRGLGAPQFEDAVQTRDDQQRHERRQGEAADHRERERPL